MGKKYITSQNKLPGHHKGCRISRNSQFLGASGMLRQSLDRSICVRQPFRQAQKYQHHRNATYADTQRQIESREVHLARSRQWFCLVVAQAQMSFGYLQGICYWLPGTNRKCPLLAWCAVSTYRIETAASPDRISNFGSSGKSATWSVTT